MTEMLGSSHLLQRLGEPSLGSLEDKVQFLGGGLDFKELEVGELLVIRKMVLRILMVTSEFRVQLEANKLSGDRIYGVINGIDVSVDDALISIDRTLKEKGFECERPTRVDVVKGRKPATWGQIKRLRKTRHI